MVLTQCSNNLIIENNVTDSSGNIFLLYMSSNNTIYHNNFNNNANQVEDTGLADGSGLSLNTWDDGYPGGGNYWSDYQTKYPDAAQIDNSSVENIPYVINSQNKDQYPLMEPFTSAFYANYLLETTPPKISVLSPLNQTYIDSSVSLDFSVDKTVSWMGYSFDGQNTTITGNTTVANMTVGLHSITVYANDTFGNMGASQTITFIVAKPESFPTATVAAVSGTSVVLAAGLLVYFKKSKRA